LNSSVNKFLFEKRWALIAILTGVILGFGSAVFCIVYHLVIFGFNIMYIVSPLLAGFVETYIAREKYGKSTGAISALITFLLINGYGWFGGYILPKEPVTLSFITIIAILLTLQAAFPIFMNYLLFVVGIGIIRKLIEFLIYIPSLILGKPKETHEKEEIIVEPSVFEDFLDELDLPLLSVSPLEDGINKYVSVVTGVAIAKEKEVEGEGRVSKLTKIIEPTTLDDMYLEEARKQATSRMLNQAKSLGANTVIDVIIDYVSMGGLQGSALIVTATGTAVITDENYRSKKTDRMDVVGLDIGDIGISNMSNEVSDVPIDNDALSAQIEEYLNEHTNKIIEEWKLSTKSDLSLIEKKFNDVALDIKDLDQRFNEYKNYDTKKFEDIENRLLNLEGENENRKIE